MLEQPAFGRRLRQLRQQQGKFQAHLAGSGMSAAYVSRLESGDRRPTERVVAYLAERLGIPAESFEEQPEDRLTNAVTAVDTLPEGEVTEETALLLAEALDTATDADPVMRWHALAQLARIHETLGDFLSQRHALCRLNELSDELARPMLQIRARLRMAHYACNHGDAETARRAAREALALSEQYVPRIFAPGELVRVNLVLVSAEAELGDLAKAALHIDKICGSLERTDGALAAEVFWTAATVSTRQGNLARALGFLEDALAAVDSRDNLILWIRLRLAVASLSLQALPPRLAEAESYLDSVEPLLKVTGPLRHWYELLFLKAKLAFHQGALDRAALLAAEAEGGVKMLSYRDQVRYEVLRGVLALNSGDADAGARLKEIIAQVQTANMPDLAAEVWRTVAESTL
ncbi:helix-turn-helix domain-containing protein [Streptomyces sp. NRRL S-455]|uniref:helix-turn-helix domain-containing protein n=1 Tax=Streptomyces sp. NRRL S-455 TaxID=1463908 RepID=UPI0004C17C85|nr:helix-turn-helix transcriptional regulator [Streptomyces sp. NRRL S-455]